MSLLRLLAFKPKGFKPAGLPAASNTQSAEAEKKNLKLDASIAESKSVRAEPFGSAQDRLVEAIASPSTSSGRTGVLTDTLVQSAPTTAFLEQKQPLAGIKSARGAIESEASDESAQDAFLEQNQPPPVIESARSAMDSVAPAQSAPELIQPLPTRMMAVPIREQGLGSARTEGRIAPVEPDAHHEAWLQLVQQLLDQQSVQGMVQQLAVQSQCVEKGASHLMLRIGQPSLKSDSLRDELQNALQALGRSEALVIEVGPVQDSWAKRNNAKLEARQKAAEALIQNDPQVQELIAQWGAKIVPGSVKAV